MTYIYNDTKYIKNWRKRGTYDYWRGKLVSIKLKEPPNSEVFTITIIAT